MATNFCFIFILQLFFSLSAFAGAPALTYHGRLLDSSSAPITGSVDFKIQIVSPGSEACVLWEETQTQTLDSGVFVLAIDGGSSTRTDGEAHSFTDTFSNSNAFTGLAHCASGNSYSPTAGDARILKVTFNDGSGWDSAPDQSINYAPFATNAYAVDGFPVASLLRVADSGVPGNIVPMTSTQYTDLLSLIAGTSNKYAQANNSTTGTSIYSGAGSPSTPTVGSIWLDTTGGTDVLKIKTDSGIATIPQSTTGNFVTSVATGTGLTGGPITSTGTISIAAGGVTATELAAGAVTSAKLASGAVTDAAVSGSINIATTGNISAAGIGTRVLGLSNAQSTPNTITLAAPSAVFTNYGLVFPSATPQAGQVLVSNASGQLSWSNPSAGSVTSVSATAISGNPIVVGGTASAPTISLPAATSSQNGYLSSTDYATFAAKLSATLATGTMLVGNASNVATAVTPSGDVTMLSTGSFTVTGLQGVGIGTTSPQPYQALIYDGASSKWIPQTLSIGSLRSIAGTAQFSASCLSSETLVWSSLTDSFTCTPIAISASAVSGLGTAALLNVGTGSNSVVQLDGAGRLPSVDGSQLTSLNAANLVSGTIDPARLPASATIWQSGGAGRIGYLGAVGIGTTNPTAYLQLPGSSGAASSAPLKFVAGTNLATPEIGAVEFDGTNLYYTNASGRQTLSTSTATGAQSFAGDVTMNGVGTGLTVTNDASVGGNFAVAGNQSITGTQTVTGLTTLSGGATSAGQVVITNATPSTSTTTGALTVVGGVGVGGAVNAAAMSAPTIVSTSITTSNLVASNNILVGGAIGVGTTSPTAYLQLPASSGAASSAPLKFGAGTLLATPEDGAIEYDGTNLYYTNSAGRQMISTDTSTGAQSFAGDVTMNGAGTGLTVTNNASVGGNVAIGGSQTVAGNQTIGSNQTVSGTQTVTGLSTLTGGLASAGQVAITNTTDSTSTTTGALTVVGGVGVGGSMNVGGSFNAVAVNAPSVSATTVTTSNLNASNNIIVNGQVGIGTTAPATALDINGASSYRGLALAPALAPANQGRLYFDSVQNQFFASQNGGAYLALATSGGAGGGQSSTSSLTFNSDTDGSGADGGFNFNANGINLLSLANNGDASFASTTGSTSTATGALKVAGGLGVAGSVNANILAASNGLASAPSHTFTNDLTSGMWLSSPGNLALSSNGAERMRISSSGNVGIGTTSPGFLLDVAGTINSSGSIYSAATIQGTFARFDYGSATAPSFSFASDNNNGMFHPASGQVAFSTSGTERVRVDSSGNVGIGTTAPTSKLTLGAGTTTLAPLQLTAGANLSTPLAGAIEFDGANLYYTDATATRRTLSTGAAGTYLPLAGGTMTGAIVHANGTTNAPSLSFANDTTTGFYSSSAGMINATVAGNTALTLNATGVGIGTTAPAYKLDVAGTINASGIRLNGSPLAADLWSTNGTDVYRMSGKIGLGTSAPTYSLDITGTSRVTSAATNGTNFAIQNTDTGGRQFTLVATGSASGQGPGKFVIRDNTGTTDRVTIDSSGNVGIGTTSPGYKLDVAGQINSLTGFSVAGVPISASGSSIWVLNGSNAYNTNSGYVGIGTDTPAVAFHTVGTVAHMGGNVGIGTTAPSANLHVVTATDGSDAIRTESNSGSGLMIMRPDGTNGNVLRWGGNGSSASILRFLSASNIERMRIDPNNGVGIGTSTPTTALYVKGPIGPITPSLSVDGGTFTVSNNGDLSLQVGEAAGLPSIYLQAKRTANDGTAWPLLLNPLGGNVGIGTTSPAYKLDVAGDINTSGNFRIAGVPISASGSSIWALNGANVYNTNSGYVGIGTDTPAVAFHTVGTVAHMGGNVGVGTTAPVYLLDVAGDAHSSSNFYANGSFKFSSGVGMGTASGGILFSTASNERLRIDNSGNVGIGTTTPGVALDIVGAINQGPNSAAGTANYLQTNSLSLKPLNLSSNLDPGILVYSGAGFKYGMDIGINGAGIYRTRLFAPNNADIAFSTHANGTNPTNQASFTDAMVVQGSTGNVGIGTTSPAYRLDVNGQINSSTGFSVAGIPLSASGSGIWALNGSNAYNTNSGYVGIGTDAPAAPLHTVGNVAHMAGFVGLGTTAPTTHLSIVDTTDVTSFYIASSGISTNSVMTMGAPLSTGVSDGKLFSFTSPGDTASRGVFYSDGKYGIGPGTATRDTFISRNATSVLKVSSDGATGAANLVVTGSVGIGTTAPTSLLHIGGSGQLVQVGDGLNQSTSMNFDLSRGFVGYDPVAGLAGALTLESGTGKGLNFSVNGTSFGSAPSSMYISSAGNVGIGTTSPGYKLDVAGTIRTSTGGVMFPDGTTQTTAAGGGGSGQWGYTNPNVWYTAGNVGIGTDTPSVALHTVGTVAHMSGNLGIGTTAPAYSLDVVGTANASTGFRSASFGLPGIGGMNNTNSILNLTTSGAQDIAFSVGSSEKMRIVQATGYIGMGTTAPAYKLDVNGTINATGIDINGSPLAADVWSTSSGNVYRATGNVGVGTTSPGSPLTVVGDISHSAGTLTSPDISASTGNSTPYLPSSSSLTNPLPKTLQVVNSSATNGAGAFQTFFVKNSVNQQRIYIGAVSTAGVGNFTPSFVVGQQTGSSSYNEDLRIDPSGNVGIGTTTPGYKLDVVGDINTSGALRINGTAISASGSNLWSQGGSGAYYTGTGNVGIGTSVPGSPLVVVGDMASYESALTNSVRLTGGQGGPGSTATANRLRFGGGGTNSNFFTIQGVSNTDYLTINNGNVGIGTTAPGYKLDVAGQINATALSINGSVLAADVWSTASGNVYRSSGNVGIGTTAPSTLLDVFGTGGGTNGTIRATDGSQFTALDPSFGLIFNRSASYITNDKVGGSIFVRTSNASVADTTPITVLAAGNVGIGTTSPAYTLDVNGSAHLSGSVTMGVTTVAGNLGAFNNFAASYVSGGAYPAPNISSSNNTAGDGNYDFFSAKAKNSANTGQTAYWGAVATATGYAPAFVIGQTTAAAAYTEAVRVDQNGNVGIGTTAPGYKLDVAGQINATALSINGSILAADVWSTAGGNVYRSSGNVGIGTTAPWSGSTTIGSYASPSLTHQTPAVASWAYGNSNSVDLSLFVQSTAPYTSSFQSRNVGTDGVAYPIALNPLGGNVGIGTTSPGSALSVVGQISSTTGMTTNGYVQSGFATSTLYAPTGSAYNPTLAGTFKAYNSSSTDGVAAGSVFSLINSNSNPQNAYIAAVSTAGAGTYTPSIVIGQQSATNAYSERLRIDPSGNVGIGTTVPGGKLDIVQSTAGSVATQASLAGTAFWAIRNPAGGVSGTLPNSANAIEYVGKDAGTNRSINAAGTVNASGADFAEWIDWSGTQPTMGSVILYRGSYVVVSSAFTAAFIGNDVKDPAHSILVAFAGQLPVLVRGIVHEGDLIVANDDGTANAVPKTQATVQDGYRAVGTAWSNSADPGLKSVHVAVGIGLAGGLRDITSLKSENAQIKADNLKLREESAAMKARLDKIEKMLNTK